MNIKIGTFYTICCCCDASIIKNQKELEKLLEDMKDDDLPYYDFYETAEDLIKNYCSCDGECGDNKERLKKLNNK